MLNEILLRGVINLTIIERVQFVRKYTFMFTLIGFDNTEVNSDDGEPIK